MRPKGKLFALLAVFAAIGLITATGAFTTVAAERTAEVNVAGDSAALLAIEPGSENGDYVDDSGGTVSIDLANAQGVSATGVNDDALTEINFVLTITNNGAQNVDLWIEKAGTNADVVTFYNGSVDTGTRLDNTSTAATGLNAGETIEVSMKIDTRGGQSLVTGPNDVVELITDVTIHAEATSS